MNDLHLQCAKNKLIFTLSMLKYIHHISFFFILFGILPISASEIKDPSSKNGDKKSEIKEYILHHLQDSHDFNLLSYTDSVGKKIHFGAFVGANSLVNINLKSETIGSGNPFKQRGSINLIKIPETKINAYPWINRFKKDYPENIEQIYEDLRKKFIK